MPNPLSSRDENPCLRDPAISVRGGVTTAGSTRFYTVWYRNTASTYCTPATSNRSNAVGMTWID